MEYTGRIPISGRLTNLRHVGVKHRVYWPMQPDMSAPARWPPTSSRGQTLGRGVGGGVGARGSGVGMTGEAMAGTPIDC